MESIKKLQHKFLVGICWANWLTRNGNKALVKAPCRLDSVMVCAEKRGGKTKKKSTLKLEATVMNIFAKHGH
jgi:hypothetical protein